MWGASTFFVLGVSVKVYNEDVLMVSLKVPDKVCRFWSICTWCITFWKLQTLVDEKVVVTQTTFDVDSWISRILPLVLQDEQYQYHCLCDYSLRVIDVSYVNHQISNYYLVIFIVDRLEMQRHFLPCSCCTDFFNC